MRGYENRMVNYISDGERQKAMIVRTLSRNTDVIVLYEPTAFLDLSNKYEIVHILHELASEKGKTILFSPHDLTTAIAESERMWVMLNDSVEQGSPEDLILNGDFASLFHSEYLFFDQEKGDFRIRKQTKRKAVVRGDGLAVDWTIKALERNGFEIIDSANDGDGAADVTIEVAYPEWTVKHQEQIAKFGSLLAMCRYMNGLQQSL